MLWYVLHEKRSIVASMPQLHPTAVKFFIACCAYSQSASTRASNFLNSKAPLLGNAEINEALYVALHEKAERKSAASRKSAKGNEAGETDTDTDTVLPSAKGEPVNVSQATKSLLEAVKALGGSYYADRLTFTELNEARLSENEKTKQALAQYRKADKELNSVYLAALNALISKSKKTFLPVEEVKRSLQDMGITRMGIPDGFVGGVGVNGRLCTSDGHWLAMNPSCPQVRMNPNYTGKDTKAYCFGNWPDAVRKSTGKVQLVSYQTVNQARMRVAQKSNKIDEGQKLLPRLQKSWQTSAEIGRASCRERV